MPMTLVLFPGHRRGSFQHNYPFPCGTFARDFADYYNKTAAAENNLVEYAASQSCSEPEPCSNVTKASRADYYHEGGGVVVSCNVAS